MTNTIVVPLSDSISAEGTPKLPPISLIGSSTVIEKTFTKSDLPTMYRYADEPIYRPPDGNLAQSTISCQYGSNNFLHVVGLVTCPFCTYFPHDLLRCPFPNGLFKEGAGRGRA